MKNNWKMKLHVCKRVERNPAPKTTIPPRLKPWSSGAVIILTASIIIGGFLSIFASAFPDGLEKAAEELNFSEKGNNLVSGFMPDYLFPGIINAKMAASLAGMIGVLLVFIALTGVGKILYRIKINQKG